MKMILKIARTELWNMFFSPVAWFMTLIFLVICAVFYSETLVPFANFQDSLLRTTPAFTGFGSLTRAIFMGMGANGFVGNVFSNLYLFIPLLTMGLINREFNNGTVKLLYSSPVKLSQIVLGKYLAVMAYNMLLLSVMIGFMVVGAFSIENIDLGHLLIGAIAFYLVVCCYTAIGMFMSSITSYQIVAAIATFILLFVLQRIGSLWQEYDFVRDLTWFLSIDGRAKRMLSGLLTTRDVMYFVLIAYMFVTFSYLSLLHGREMVSRTKKAGRYLAVFLTAMIVGYLTSRPGYVGYWDGTREKINTIHGKTQNILKSMQDDPLEVTLYTNLLGNGFDRTRPSQRNTYIWDIWDPYIRFKQNITFKYVLYYDLMDGDSSRYKSMPNMTLDAIAKEYAKMYDADIDWYLKPAEIRKMIDLQPENLRSVMQLKYKGKSIYLRTYNDQKFWPNEDHFAAALKRLVNDTIPKIYASTGNLERDMYKTGEREYYKYSIDKSQRLALINHGFEFDSLNLNTRDIPADATALVLADPKVLLNKTVTSRLKQFINTGGNLLVMGEPGKQNIVNPLLGNIGVQLMPGTLVQISRNETPDKVTPYVTIDHSRLLKNHATFSELISKKLQNGDSTKVLHAGAAPVSFVDSGFKVTRLMVTGPKGYVWVKAGHLVTDSAAPVLVANEGDYRLDSFNVALALSRHVDNKEQKIAVVGDADFMSTMRSGSNWLGQNYLSWMNDECFPVVIVSDPPTDRLLTISLDAAKVQKLILVWVLPVGLLILASIILIRRKRQ